MQVKAVVHATCNVGKKRKLAGKEAEGGEWRVSLFFQMNHRLVDHVNADLQRQGTGSLQAAGN